MVVISACHHSLTVVLHRHCYEWGSLLFMDGGCGHWPYRSWMVVGTCHRSLMVGVIVGNIVERDGGREQKVRAKKVELVTSII